MIDVKVIDEKFTIGNTTYKKDSVVSIPINAVAYACEHGCSLIKEEIEIPKSKVLPKKKSTYKTKVQTSE